MFSNLATIRHDLADRLTAAVDQAWRIQDGLRDSSDRALVPVIGIEYTTVDQAAGASPLPHGQVSAGIDVLIIDPSTSLDTGESDLDEALPVVLDALDQHPDIGWTTGEKQRTGTGQLVWRIHTISIVNLKETP